MKNQMMLSGSCVVTAVGGLLLAAGLDLAGAREMTYTDVSLIGGGAFLALIAIDVAALWQRRRQAWRYRYACPVCGRAADTLRANDWYTTGCVHLHVTRATPTQCRRAWIEWMREIETAQPSWLADERSRYAAETEGGLS